MTAKFSQYTNTTTECGSYVVAAKTEKYRKRRRVHHSATLGIEYPFWLSTFLLSLTEEYPEVLIRVQKDRGQGNNQVKGQPIQQVILTW